MYKKGKKKKYIYAGFIFITLSVYLMRFVYAQDSDVVQIVVDPRLQLQKTVDAVKAKSVIVFDMTNRSVLAEKDIHTKRSLASLTKVITARLVYEHTSSTRKFLVLPTIQHMLTTSSNEEAEDLLRTLGSTQETGLKKMNDATASYGFMFKNASGLDVIYEDTTRDPGSLGSAYEFARYATEAYYTYPELFDTTIQEKDNTNIIVNQLSFMLGGKTGFTDLAGGNLMVMVQKGIHKKYMIVVLGSTEKGRFVDVEDITRALLQLDI